MNVRGFASINQESKPLILIDGMEGNIDKINPRDVESISVLKDASSSVAIVCGELLYDSTLNVVPYASMSRVAVFTMKGFFLSRDTLKLASPLRNRVLVSPLNVLG